MVSRNVLTFIFSILFMQLAGIDLIQNEIQVLENYVIVDFPRTIEFKVGLENEDIIEGVTLIYGTNATTCSSGGSRQPQDITAGENIELEWQWDLKRSGAIPPGAEIWWQWEIEDEYGQVVTTDRQFHTVVDDRNRWQEVSDSNVTVYWYEGDKTFGQSMLAIAIDSLEQLSRDVGIETSQPIQLWIYPTTADVRDSVINTYDWTGGVAFPNYGITVVGLRPGQDDWAAEVIPHELAHLVVGAVVSNCRGGRMPTWLGEGLAELAAGGSSQSNIDSLEDRLAEDHLPSLPSLSRGFSAYSGDAELAYTQSAQIVQYMIEVYGQEKMAELLDHIRLGESIDDALETTYGFDTTGLDAEWRISKGYAPKPTSAAESSLQDATPTIVPTLALMSVPISASPTEPAATSETVVATIIPTVPPSATAVLPSDTETPVVVSEVKVPSAMKGTAVPSRSDAVETSNIFLFLGAVGTSIIILIGVIIFIRSKGG